MSKANIPVYTCERCNTTEELRQTSLIYGWGEFWAAQCNGPIWFGSMKKNEKTLDLCPRCMGELKTWFSNLPDTSGVGEGK